MVTARTGDARPDARWCLTPSPFATALPHAGADGVEQASPPSRRVAPRRLGVLSLEVGTERAPPPGVPREFPQRMDGGVREPSRRSPVPGGEPRPAMEPTPDTASAVADASLHLMATHMAAHLFRCGASIDDPVSVDRVREASRAIVDELLAGEHRPIESARAIARARAASAASNVWFEEAETIVRLLRRTAPTARRESHESDESLGDLGRRLPLLLGILTEPVFRGRRDISFHEATDALGRAYAFGIQLRIAAADLHLRYVIDIALALDDAEQAPALADSCAHPTPDGARFTTRFFGRLAAMASHVMEEHDLAELRALWRGVCHGVPAPRRRQLVMALVHAVADGHQAPSALLPILLSDTDPALVAVAARYVAMWSAPDEKQGERLAMVSLLRRFCTTVSEPGAAAGIAAGLLGIGDRRVYHALHGLWVSLSTEVLDVVLSIVAEGPAYAGLVDWCLEAMADTEGERFGRLAAALVQLAATAGRDEVIEVVTRIGASPSPLLVGTEVRMHQPLRTFAQHLAPAMRRLAADEHPPRVMPQVQSLWGVEPLSLA